jgi:metal-responsive CopG/Arc/MetJ family transcriptional regulator
VCNMADRKVKTTIDMPEDLWKDFSIRVIQEHGGRKKNDVIEELIRKYLREAEKGGNSSSK